MKRLVSSSVPEMPEVCMTQLPWELPLGAPWQRDRRGNLFSSCALREFRTQLTPATSMSTPGITLQNSPGLRAWCHTAASNLFLLLEPAPSAFDPGSQEEGGLTSGDRPSRDPSPPGALAGDKNSHDNCPQQGWAPPAALNHHRRALSSSSSQFPQEGGEKEGK